MKKIWQKIATEYVVSPWPVYSMSRAFVHGLRKNFGLSVDHWVIVFQKQSSLHLTVPAEWNTVSKKLAKRLLSDLNLFARLFGKIRKECLELVALAKRINKMRFDHITSENLVKLMEKYTHQNYQVYSWAMFMPLLDFQSTTYVTNAVKDMVEKKLAPNVAADAFTVLTTPLQDSIARKEEIDLLKIASQTNELTIKRLLNLHCQKYNWMTYVYEGPALTVQDFRDRLKDIKKRKVNPKQALTDLKKSTELLRRRQQHYLRLIKPTSRERKLIQLAQNFVFYKAWRREMQSHSYYLLERFFQTIARRLRIPVAQVKFLLISEIKNSLKKGGVDKQLIRQRQRLCAVTEQFGRPTKIIHGPAVRSLLKQMIEEKIHTNLRQLSGTVASAGQASGTVKIINTPTDMANMKDHDVLVSFATNPNLMPAIRKAAAIVTDEGGLTCHAAIVSRELKIPCVIGTKVATKILKDGDKVEVDATQGVVRKK